MADKNIESDYSEIKHFKLILFEFFLNINQYRSLKKFNAMLLVTISFLQIYYMLNQLLVVESLAINSKYTYTNTTNSTNSSISSDTTNSTNTEISVSTTTLRYLNDITNLTDFDYNYRILSSSTPTNSTNNVSAATAAKDPYYYVDPDSDFGKAIDLIIFDPINIAMKASFVIPLLEYELNIFGDFYTILFICVYIFTIMLLISCVYTLIKICKGKEVYFKISLEVISTSFLFLQWIFYLPILYILLYPFFGRLYLLIPNFFFNVVLKTVNIIFVVFFIFLNFIISILNNDSISKYDNSLCRKNTNLETTIFFLQTILFFTLIFNIPLAISVILVTVTCVLISYLIYILYENKIFYNDQIGKIFGAYLLCFLQKYIGGMIVVFSKVYIIDYSFTIIVCFIINIYIFDFFYNRMKTIILKKKLNELKSVEEVLLYVEMLEKEMLKTLIGDPVSCSMMAGYILNHKNNCIRANCPLNVLELYHPLTDSKLEITSNKIQDLYKSEIVLIHLLKEIYVTLCEKFNGKGKFHFAYSVFLLFRMGNNKLALIEIENSSNYENTLQEEYSFYLLKHNTNESLINNKNFISNDYSKLSISILDIMDVVVFDQLCQDLQSGMFDCSKLKIEFWATLKQNRIMVEDLYKKGNEYINKKNYVSKLWKKMILITTSNRKIIELYGKYLEFICDDLSAPVQENKRVTNIGEIDHNDVVFTRFNDDTGFMIINLSLGPLIGNIHYYNKAINKILYYSSDYLYGKNINIIMPNAIGEAHNQILTNFVQSGKNNMIGRSTEQYAKDKEQYLKPINLFIMPMPSYNYKSEVIGLIKERSSNSLYMICNEFGEIDSFSRDFHNHNDTFEPVLLNKLDINFYVFFLFPELLQPNSDKKPRLFFSDRNESTFSINAYFDPYLIPILSEMDISKNKKDMKINIQKKKKDKLTKDLKYIKNNFPNEANTRIKMYYNFCAICNKIKELLQFDNKEFTLDYIQEYKEFIYFMENVTKDNYIPEENDKEKFLSQFHIKKVVKKVYNLKVTPYKYYHSYGYENKLFILELTIPPTDLENEENNSKDKNHSDNMDEDNNINTGDKENNSMQNDDLGSVSSTSTNNVNSIQNIVNKIREEMYGADNLNKSSQVNICLLFIMSILLGFLIYYNIYIIDYTNQMDIQVQAVSSYYNLKRSIYDFRELTSIDFLNTTLENAKAEGVDLSDISMPEYNTEEIYEKKIEFSLVMLNLEKNISFLMIDMNDKETIKEINYKKFSLEDGKVLYHNDIIGMLTYDSIIIAQPVRIAGNEDIDALFSGIGITTTEFIYETDENVIETHINSYLSLSRNQIQDSISSIIQILVLDLYRENDNINRILLISYGIIIFVCIFFTILIFIILKKRYKLNQSILELLNLIKQEDINEIIFKVEEFINELKSINYNLENKIIQNLDTKSDVEDVDNIDVNTALLETKSAHSGQNTASTSANSTSGYTNQANSLNKNKKNKNIRRRENIMISFTINIIIILTLVGLFLFLIHYFSNYCLSKYNLIFDYMIIVFESFSQNQKILSNLKDVFIFNDNITYDYEKKVSNFFTSNFNISKYYNEKVFRSYSENKTDFTSSLINNFDTLYFGDLCSTTSQNLVSISCDVSVTSNNTNSTSTSADLTNFDIINIDNDSFSYANSKDTILNKGFKYLIDYYSNSIENLLSVYESSTENNLYLPSVYISRITEFYLPTYLIFNELRTIFDKITLDLENAFFDVSNKFIVLIAIISSVFMLFEFLIIVIKWRKYINQIRLEEYMSNKIIAEIPMYIIRQNKGICEHLLDYSNKNS